MQDFDRGLRASIAADILTERNRQIVDLCRTTEHDDEHVDGSLAMAAALYAAPAQLFIQRRLVTADAVHFMDPWPWEKHADKRRRRHRGDMIPNAELPYEERRRQLVKAAALIVAEIERLDRAELGRLQDELPPGWIFQAPANEGAAADKTAVAPGSTFGEREG